MHHSIFGNRGRLLLNVLIQLVTFLYKRKKSTQLTSYAGVGCGGDDVTGYCVCGIVDASVGGGLSSVGMSKISLIIKSKFAESMGGCEIVS